MSCSGGMPIALALSASGSFPTRSSASRAFRGTPASSCELSSARCFRCHTRMRRLEAAMALATVPAAGSAPAPLAAAAAAAPLAAGCDTGEEGWGDTACDVASDAPDPRAGRAPLVTPLSSGAHNRKGQTVVHEFAQLAGGAAAANLEARTSDTTPAAPPALSAPPEVISAGISITAEEAHTSPAEEVRKRCRTGLELCD